MHVHMRRPAPVLGEPQHNWSRRILATQVVVQADCLDEYCRVEHLQRVSRGFRPDPTVRGGALIVHPQLHRLIVPGVRREG